MRDSDWKVIYELSKEMSISDVAEKLFYSQPSLTKKIQSMERELGVKILLRSSKGIKLTPEGEYLAKQSQRYLELYEETQKQLKILKNEQVGALRIGSSYTFSKNKLPNLLYEYTREDSVHFDIVTKQSEDLFKEIENYDGAFIHGEYRGNFDSILIDVEKAYVLSKQELEVEDLPYQPMITYKTNDKTLRAIDEWWRENFKVNPNHGVFAGYVDVAWELAMKDFGYVICFLSDTFENRYDLNMMELYDKEGKPLTRNTYFIYSKTKERSELLNDFIEFLNMKGIKE